MLVSGICSSKRFPDMRLAHVNMHEECHHHEQRSREKEANGQCAGNRTTREAVSFKYQVSFNDSKDDNEINSIQILLCELLKVII